MNHLWTLLAGAPSVFSMLQDTTTYRRIKKNSSPVLEWKMNSMLLDLKKKGDLSDTVYQRLCSIASRTPFWMNYPKFTSQGLPCDLLFLSCSCPLTSCNNICSTSYTLWLVYLNLRSVRLTDRWYICCHLNRFCVCLPPSPFYQSTYPIHSQERVQLVPWFHSWMCF